MTVTQKQIDYINILIQDQIDSLTYDPSGWGFKTKDLCNLFGIRILRGKSDMYKVLADALISEFGAYLVSLDVEGINKADASKMIDNLKSNKIRQIWLNLSEDINERAAQLNTLAGQEITEVRENAAGNERVYAK